MIETWLDQHDGEMTALETYRGYFRRTIEPNPGNEPTGKMTAKVLEKFYAQLRKCSVICKAQPRVDHRTTRTHECRVVKHRRRPGRPSAKDAVEHDCEKAGRTVVECKPHTRRPMGRSTIRQIHAIISGSLGRRVSQTLASTV